MKQNKYLHLLVASIIFTSPVQSIGVGVPSAALTLSAQESIPQTGCIALETSSQTGTFSSNATNWNPVTVLTMNKGTSNRSFFYKDSTAGTHTLTASFALKPASVTDSCAAWPRSEWTSVLQAIQSISIGSSGSQPSSNNQTTSTTSAATQTTVNTAPRNIGSETLTIKITSQPVVVVGAGSSFTGSATNSHGATGSDTRYIWNFGDGSTKEGNTAFHTFTYPGTYNVMLSAGSGDKAGVGRALVQAVSAKIGMRVEADGSVLVSNLAPQELNLGLWNISSGLNTFQIPPDTVMPAGQSIRFSPAIMRMVAGADTVLKYPNNFLAHTVGLVQEPIEPVPSKKPSSPQRGEFSAKNSPTSGVVTPAYVSDKLVSVAATGAVDISLWPYVVGALGLILIGAGLFLKKNPWKKVTNTPADEFDI